VKTGEARKKINTKHFDSIRLRNEYDVLTFEIGEWRDDTTFISLLESTYFVSSSPNIKIGFAEGVRNKTVELTFNSLGARYKIQFLYKGMAKGKAVIIDEHRMIFTLHACPQVYCASFFFWN